ncbi:MAG: 16S rRNA (cytosine(1402)-N(4))-methyltransferase RsmH [Bdellovibrionaceae bacterium]|jgi:16S rRNA (cytosine1402-N4)-methyltransferase|nr:16S rRNA (cytosine(1402)-N(4))-methyltransferase RsmH [Pseudobdellovibrionaceae bacterium]
MLHIPVLLKDVLNQLPQKMEVGVDGTFGRGGHCKAIMDEYGDCKMIGLDRDIDAISFGQEQFKEDIENNRLKLFHSNYIEIDETQKNNPADFPEEVDFILVDLGVSSPQLDEAERGFSFYSKGPLDMRMDQREKLTAAEIVNEWSEEDLYTVFQKYGEVRNPNRIVKAIVMDRQTKDFETTDDLSRMIERVLGWSQKGKHPATQYFLALRLIVNQELQQVEDALEMFINRLSHKGRLLVITFHSLEDRIVKYKFKALKDLGNIITKKVIQATWDEKKTNPRSRSAKLRVFERIKQ